MLPIRVITGLPGSGKTRHVINQISSIPGKYLFATSRRELIRERMSDIRHAAKEFGTSPDLFPIYSPDGKATDTQDRPIDFSVASEIRSLPHRHAEAAHVVAMVTHEGLMSADLSGFEGWHLVIDENPSAVASGSFCAAAAALYLDRAYELTPEPGTNFHRVSLKRLAPSPRALLRDDLLKDIIPFDKRARSTHGVLVDISDWDDALDSDRVVQWYSVWSLADLKAFASISIAAAGYMESLAFKAEQNASLSYKIVPVPEIPRARPRIEIGYFATHRGSTDYWTNPEKPEGNEAFTKVVAYLKTVDLGYWATNDATEDFMRGAGLSGTMLKPKTEGTNSYRHLTSCAFIYSNKAQRSDTPLLKAFKLKRDDIQRAREGEDVIQFVFRGAIRNPDFAGTYRIYLYEKEQAEALAAYFNEHAIGDVDLIPVEEAGIMEVSRPKTGPKPLYSPEERRARDRERKQRDRADKKALVAKMTALNAKSEGKAA